MTSEEKILRIIEKISKYNNGATIEIGTLDNNLGINAHNITIPRSSVLYLDYLLERRAKKVAGIVESGGAGDSAHTHIWTDKSEYIEPLKSGDRVIFYQISKSNVIVLGRVV